jgi:hypothetical protein
MPDTTPVPKGFNSTAQTPGTRESVGGCLGRLETCHSRLVSTDPDTMAVLALVTSAGGLNALIHVLAPLPADLIAAVLVVQHQSSDRPSTSLADILDARTTLQVSPARDGDRLQPGHVLSPRAATHMIVTPTSALALIDSGQLPPSGPSAEVLLATLTVTCGPRTGRRAHRPLARRPGRHPRGAPLGRASSSPRTGHRRGVRHARSRHRHRPVHAVVPLSELPALIIRQLQDSARKTVS